MFEEMDYVTCFVCGQRPLRSLRRGKITSQTRLILLQPALPRLQQELDRAWKSLCCQGPSSSYGNLTIPAGSPFPLYLPSKAHSKASVYKRLTRPLLSLLQGRFNFTSVKGQHENKKSMFPAWGWVMSPHPWLRSCGQLMAAGAGRVGFFKGVAPVGHLVDGATPRSIWVGQIGFSEDMKLGGDWRSWVDLGGVRDCRGSDYRQNTLCVYMNFSKNKNNRLKHL